jgi:dTDP-glucose 4,6-dehydratase
VDDLVDGLLRMLGSDHGGPVNLGNPHEVSILELAEWIRKLTRSTCEIRLIPRPQDDPERRRPDITMARELLDWEPMTPVEQGLRDTITDFRLRLVSGDFSERKKRPVPSPLTASARS